MRNCNIVCENSQVSKPFCIHRHPLPYVHQIRNLKCRSQALFRPSESMARVKAKTFVGSEIRNFVRSICVKNREACHDRQSSRFFNFPLLTADPDHGPIAKGSDSLCFGIPSNTRTPLCGTMTADFSSHGAKHFKPALRRA